MARTISVAMCTFNGARFLDEQLRSIDGQERLPDELVVSDDGSVDETPAILERFRGRARFPVRVHRNAATLGPNQNFGQAISLCRGDLIAPSDQDDVWAPSKLAELERALASDEVGLALCDSELVDEALNPIGRRFSDGEESRRRFRRLQDGRAFEALLGGNVVPGHASLFRADLARIVLPIPTDLVISVYDWWIALVVSAVAAIAFVPEPLVRYRQHAGQCIGGLSSGPRGSRLRRHDGAGAVAALEEVERRIALLDGAPERRTRARTRVQRYIGHLRARQALPAARWKRGWAVSRELVSGNYHLYASGVSSAIKDLIVG